MEEAAPQSRVAAPGLKWIKRRASDTPTWVASAKDYKPRTVNLAHLADKPEQLVAKCELLQAEMRAWAVGYRVTAGDFDGTIRYLLLKYQSDPESPYFALRFGSRRPYDYYISKLTHQIGNRRIDTITGIDLKRWHNQWSDGGEKLAGAAMQRAVLDAAVSFGIMSQKPGSAELRAVMELREVLKAAGRKLPQPKRRDVALKAHEVVALRAAAHADGAPSRALAYALVFESTLRLWDVIGQWVPVAEPGITDVARAAGARRVRVAKKWIGLRWDDIGDDNVMRYVPSKTSDKTGRSVTYPLSRAPMVMEELAHWPLAARTGPVIVSEATGEPYFSNNFAAGFRCDRKAAGLPVKVWARDLRASGITEGRGYGATTDDAGKVAGHAGTRTTSEVYDRANLEAAERFADVRSRGRNG
jgi:integrase